MIDEYLKYIQEGYLLSDKNVSVNLKDFESGEKNKLLIIGVMGSGKTTWAEFLSKNKSKMVGGRYPARLPRVKWRSGDNIWYEISQKYFKHIKDNHEVKDEITKLVRIELIKMLKDNRRMIIESVDFIDIYKDQPQYRKLIVNQPMIILGMSALRAGIRAGIRNMRREGGEGWRELYWMSLMNIRDLEATLKQIRKDVKKMPGAKIENYKIPRL